MNGYLEHPMVIFTKYSPYMVVDLQKFTGAAGKDLKIEPVMSLCRCGASKFKPYCDGSHVEAGFSGDKIEGRTNDRVKNYTGKDITVHDNRGVCCHDGSCVNKLPAVFRKEERPWIYPDGGSAGDIIQTIESCPSGALSYTIGSRRYQDLECSPEIHVIKNGPLFLKGRIVVKNDTNDQPECTEHCTLCRCGGSKNKPFCDGEHEEINFQDDNR